MTDTPSTRSASLVERLRELDKQAQADAPFRYVKDVFGEAAAEIERLAADNARLRAALQEIEQWSRAYLPAADKSETIGGPGQTVGNVVTPTASRPLSATSGAPASLGHRADNHG